MMRFYIYCITNIINNKKYIGKTNNPEKRWNEHIRISSKDHFKSNSFSLIHKAIKKYGINNFKFEILEDFTNEEEAYKFETWWIDYCGTFAQTNNGYNCNYGGFGSLNPSLETRNKISKALKGRKISNELRKKLSEINIGENNPNYGLKRSKETIDKMSIAQRGEKNPCSKLSENDILNIRNEYKEKINGYRKLGIKYNVDPSTIRNIIKRKVWKHI